MAQVQDDFRQQFNDILEKVRSYNAQTIKTMRGGNHHEYDDKELLRKVAKQLQESGLSSESLREQLHRAKDIIREAKRMPGDVEANARHIASRVTKPKSFFEEDLLVL